MIVTASEIDSLDVHVSLREYENLVEAYLANGLEEKGEPGSYTDDGEPIGDMEEHYRGRTTIVAEIPDGPLPRYGLS